ncbi:MAG: hypothetical protein RL088_83 [Verrucomicrobiota bacterium]|jgi:putative oxidoreductase
MWAILSRNRDAGILLLRIWLGVVFLWVHGAPTLLDDDVLGRWQFHGTQMGLWGISWPAPKFWGFLSMLVHTGGIVLFILGLLFRPSCLLLAIVMAVAATYEFSTKRTFSAGLREASHAIELGLVFLAMMFIGPGKYSIDRE